jgi:hypothetical protein
MEEEYLDFLRLFQVFLRLLPTQPANNTSLKDKSNPKKAYPKCKCNSSSITQKIKVATTTTAGF